MAPVPDALLAILPRSLGLSVATNTDPPSLSPTDIHNVHFVRRADQNHADYGAGSRPATDFNNKGFQALFAIIGMGMVLTAIWFFFWAKNGGFKFQEGDWEDYKSTVLRRKGPDGKTLSNATKSTKLGGGSVVKGGSYGAPSTVGYTDETGTNADYGEMREVEEGKARSVFGLRGGNGRKDKHGRKHTNDYKDEDLREYRGERPARVGGLNRQADGIYTDYSATEPSELGSNVSGKPLVKSKDPKDKKKEAKEKERRAKERMRQAKLIEKNAARTAAAEAKAKKEEEKAEAKRAKAEQKKEKKTKRTETEYTPSEAPMTEGPCTEYAQSEAPRTEYVPIEQSHPAPGPAQARRAPPSAAYSFTTGDDTNTVYTGTYTADRTAPSEGVPESSYYSDYRPNADPSVFQNRSRRDRPSQSRSQPRSQARSESRSRHSSPRKHHRSSHRSGAPSDIFTQHNGDVQGTIAYPCHIPGLSSAGSVGVSESISQVGGPRSAPKRERGSRDVMDGYRRGGIRPVGRRDSLSDSDS